MWPRLDGKLYECMNGWMDGWMDESEKSKEILEQLKEPGILIVSESS